MTERARPHTSDDPIEASELPSLPDGGLSANMPSWLRKAPAFVQPSGREQPSAIDPGSLTSGLVLPEWLSDLSARLERGQQESPAVVQPGVPSEPDVAVLPVASDETPFEMAKAERVDDTAPVLIPVEPALEVVPATTEPYVEPPYGRIGLLLILFAIGVIAFTLWTTTN